MSVILIYTDIFSFIMFIEWLTPVTLFDITQLVIETSVCGLRHFTTLSRLPRQDKTLTTSFLYKFVCANHTAVTAVCLCLSHNSHCLFTQISSYCCLPLHTTLYFMAKHGFLPLFAFTYHIVFYGQAWFSTPICLYIPHCILWPSMVFYPYLPLHATLYFMAKHGFLPLFAFTYHIVFYGQAWFSTPICLYIPHCILWPSMVFYPYLPLHTTLYFMAKHGFLPLFAFTYRIVFYGQAWFSTPICLYIPHCILWPSMGFCPYLPLHTTLFFMAKHGFLPLFAFTYHIVFYGQAWFSTPICLYMPHCILWPSMVFYPYLPLHTTLYFMAKHGFLPLFAFTYHIVFYGQAWFSAPICLYIPHCILWPSMVFYPYLPLHTTLFFMAKHGFLPLFAFTYHIVFYGQAWFSTPICLYMPHCILWPSMVFYPYSPLHATLYFMAKHGFLPLFAFTYHIVFYGQAWFSTPICLYIPHCILWPSMGFYTYLTNNGKTVGH